MGLKDEKQRMYTPFESALALIKVGTKKIKSRRFTVSEDERKFIMKKVKTYKDTQFDGYYIMSKRQREIVQKALADFERLK